MKQLLLYIGLGLGAPLTFLGLIYGMYLLYPRLKGYNSPEAYVAALDSLRHRRADEDSLRASGPSSPADSADAADSAGTSSRDDSLFSAALWDSLAQLRARLLALEAEVAELRRARSSTSPVSGGQAPRLQELATAIAKLKAEELGRILGQLDHNTLRQLFWEIEASRRPVLLRALPPERAAALIQDIVRSR
ncbi:MAG: hypothetical protein RMK61_03300 [Bacteroidota bacterium]|nr:hypothetical protein [Bacteroidota bacterium]MDW8137462.1 hypothetical protein [Bacteroidota bacterium]